VNETTLYLRYADGSVAQMVNTTPADDIPVPDGAEVITAEEYATAKAAITEANAARAAQLEQELQTKARADYDALVAVGVPQETAARLSGYTPPDETPDDE
jgi:hypothetical protein